MEAPTMFHIALCDNDPTQRDHFITCIKGLRQTAEPVQLQLYQRSRALLDDYQQGIRFNLVILGTVLENRELLTLARAVRYYDAQVPIMVLASTSRYSLEGYEIPLYRYYKEPFQPYVFTQDLRELMEQNLFTQRQPFLFSNWQGLHRLTLEEILYFKSEGSRILLATEHEK